MKVRLKQDGEYAITLFFAHCTALMAEAVAIDMAVRSYLHDHSLLPFALPFIGIMPWLGAMAAIKRYKQMDEPIIRTEMRRDISCELGGVVFSAYLLFIFAIIK
jgi:hypothetical protein